MTEPADRERLLKIARDAVVAQVRDAGGPERAAPQFPGERAALQFLSERAAPQFSKELGARAGGAFVTIHHRGELRGCIGHVEADRPLIGVIEQCAVSACSVDPRFAPIDERELAEVDIELSLLGPLEQITGPGDIEIGRHGLVVADDGRRGLLLPQVATEWQWDALTFLTQTCRKAGLPADAWKSGATVWRFEAEVFGGPLLT